MKLSDSRTVAVAGPVLFGGLLLASLVVVSLTPHAAVALEIDIPRPGPREFVRDEAEMIDPADEQKIRELCDKLLTDKATPIIVVTIDSMARHGGEGLRIETFARLLFDQWQIGHAKLGDATWNTGILLLVSKDDRQARIELGAGWGREKDQLCEQIMQDYIIANFKQGDFTGGILAGVEALDKMARELQLPTVPRPWWHYALVAAAIGLAIFTVVSLIRRGSSGWAWLFWGVVFSVIGYMLYSFLTSRGGGSGGGFSGGSFGGGFSGGGGASGSW
ncbi:MAG: TPM domain-containing protein [Pirellulaceae bacterium]